MGKPPAFLFNVADWLLSDTIAIMTVEQEGAYIRLLARQWHDETCTLPDDDEVLSRLSRLNGKWATEGKLVRSCFQPMRDQPGRIANPRLYEEWISANERLEKWTENGRKGGRPKTQSKPMGIPRANPLGNQNLTQPEPINKEIKKEIKDTPAADAASPSPRKKFEPPSVEEVREYVTEKGYVIDPEAFVAFYESKGWKVGTTAMKSWQAACTTWSKRNGTTAKARPHDETPEEMAARIEANLDPNRHVPSYFKREYK